MATSELDAWTREILRLDAAARVEVRQREGRLEIWVGGKKRACIDGSADGLTWAQLAGALFAFGPSCAEHRHS
jgi:hypothetical protein